MSNSTVTFTVNEFVDAARALFEQVHDIPPDASSPAYTTFDGMMTQLRHRAVAPHDWLADHIKRELEPGLLERILKWPSSALIESADHGALDPDAESDTVDQPDDTEFDNDFDDTNSDWSDDVFDDYVTSGLGGAVCFYTAPPKTDLMALILAAEQPANPPQTPTASPQTPAASSQTLTTSSQTPATSPQTSFSFSSMKQQLEGIFNKTFIGGEAVDADAELHMQTEFEDTSGVNVKVVMTRLESVALPSISQDESRCPHCWGDFNKQGCIEPVKTPCGHIFGRDCLLQSLRLYGPLCPKCRQNLVLLARSMPRRTN